MPFLHEMVHMGGAHVVYLNNFSNSKNSFLSKGVAQVSMVHGSILPFFIKVDWEHIGTGNFHGLLPFKNA